MKLDLYKFPNEIDTEIMRRERQTDLSTHTLNAHVLQILHIQQHVTATVIIGTIT